MSPDTPSKPTKLCPTCGTRVSEDAARCLVCGTELSGAAASGKPAKGVQASRMPEITLNLPAVLGLLALFLSIGAGLVFFALRETDRIVEPTVTPTVTLTTTPTTTPTPVTPTATYTPEPSPTPQTYVVKALDTCAGVAFNFGISIQSIVLLNNLSSDCSALFEGQELLIPQPTPTPSPQPSATLSSNEATEQACEKVEYVVQQNDTLSSISGAYGVPMSVIREYNGLPSETVFAGQPLTIPLCMKNPTPGPSPTPTLPPPYAAANLLLPSDGAVFTASDESVTLQWASVGTLLENEVYQVTVLDITQGDDRKLVDYVTDTKFIVPATLRPTTDSPHAFRWWVTPMRQTGTDSSGEPIWEPAGAASLQRVFIWSGGAPATGPTAAP